MIRAVLIRPGRKSRSQFLVFLCVHVDHRPPLSPWTATMLGRVRCRSVRLKTHSLNGWSTGLHDGEQAVDHLGFRSRENSGRRCSWRCRIYCGLWSCGSVRHSDFRRFQISILEVSTFYKHLPRPADKSLILKLEKWGKSQLLIWPQHFFNLKLALQASVGGGQWIRLS